MSAAKYLLPILLSVLLPVCGARAEKADRDKPVNIEADSARVDDVQKLAIYEGKVVLRQGSLWLSAERVEVRQDDAGFTFGTAVGSPVQFRQKLEGRDEFAQGWAERIDYDARQEVIRLQGDARLKKGEEELRGSLITYNAKNEFFQASGSLPGQAKGRVRAVILPKPGGNGGSGDKPAGEAKGGSEMSVLAAEALRKRYRDRQVVSDVSLEVASGEVVGLLGPNGAGKTTCFYILVGLIRSDGGRIRLDEQDITQAPIHRRARQGLAYLPQEASIFRKLSVAENIVAVLELRGLKGDELEEHLLYLLEDLHITHLRDARALSLSGGERRRVEIARALAMQPRFVLLDEPFAGIDPISVLDIQKIIRFLVDRDIGVLITDHNVRETLGICDRAYIINQGSVLASGAPDAIIYNESVRKVYLGEHFRL